MTRWGPHSGHRLNLRMKVFLAVLFCGAALVRFQQSSLDIYSIYTRLDVRAAGDTEVIIQLSQVTRASVLPRSEVHSPT